MASRGSKDSIPSYIDSDDADDIARQQSHESQQAAASRKLKAHSVCLLLLTVSLLLWWLFTVIVFNGMVDVEQIADKLDLYYTISELAANAVVLLFSFYIYRRYIGRMLGDSQSTDCTHFDVYAILSLLWTLMLSLLYLIDSQYRMFAFQLVRATALIVPGYIHKSYIRFKVHAALDAHHYLGDVQVYKVVLILFYGVHLFSNMIQVPLNDDKFADSISDLFDLEHSNDFHFPFIVASVVGRPFLTMLLFHSLMLNITWFAKPGSYHDMDLFALAFHPDASLNIKVCFVECVSH